MLKIILHFLKMFNFSIKLLQLFLLLYLVLCKTSVYSIISPVMEMSLLSLSVQFILLNVLLGVLTLMLP